MHSLNNPRAKSSSAKYSISIHDSEKRRVAHQPRLLFKGPRIHMGTYLHNYEYTELKIVL